MPAHPKRPEAGRVTEGKAKICRKAAVDTQLPIRRPHEVNTVLCTKRKRENIGIKNVKTDREKICS